MSSPASTAVEDAEIAFLNMMVPLVTTKRTQEMDLIGLRVDAHEAGDEFQAKYWLALLLEKAGIARLKEENPANLVALQKIQWRETLQPGRHLVELPPMFYPYLRTYMTALEESGTLSSKDELLKASKLAQDIVNSRLNSIVRICRAASRTDIAVKNLSEEEMGLFEALNSIIVGWLKTILQKGRRD